MHKELKQLREEENVSQAFMALELGVSRPTYIAIEQGKREMSFKEVCKIAKFFNVNIHIRPEYWVIIIPSKPEVKFAHKHDTTGTSLEWHEGGLEFRD